MAQATHALPTSIAGRNPTTLTHETAALYNEVSAALFVWASLRPSSRKERKVCAHIAHLKARLGRVASVSREDVRHG